MADAKRSKIKRIKSVTAGLLIVLILSLPAAGDARGEFSIEFGAGLVTGYLIAPRPIYVPPPTYALPPEVVQIYPGTGPTSPPGQAPTPKVTPSPAAPLASGYAGSSTPTESDNQAKCREWRLVERRLEDRWDSSSGKWQQVPVEKWDWVEIACDRPGQTPEAQRDAHIEPPPAYSFSATPEVAVIPGTYAYVVPDPGVDILFYQGYWYRPYTGRWFFAMSYNGPWVYLAPPRVPHVLLNLPHGYRRLPPGYHRIPYRELRTNWRRWESERHWQSHRGWREGWRGRPEGRGGEERRRGREDRRN